MKKPTIEDILDVLPGKSRGSLAKAAALLNEKGFTDGNGFPIKPQYVRLRIAETDQSGEYDRAQEVLTGRNAKATNHRLRKDIAALVERVGTQEAFFDGLADVVSRINATPPVCYPRFVGAQAGLPMTVEVLLSDLQIGKLSPTYNTEVARKRLYELGRAVLFQIEQKISLGYRVERIVLGLLGDIIESDKKHKNSARATDTGTAEQIADAIEGIWQFIVQPLAKLGIPMDIAAVPGNHDWDDHGMGMFRPGRDMLSFPLYRSLEMLTRAAGYGNVKWDIAEGTYTTVDFYGQKALYEHGVGVSCAEAAMKAHKIKRSEQEGRHLTYFRMGDKHNVSTFDCGRYVVNGAFFGSGPTGQEYSGIAGFSSVAGQWMGFHVARPDKRLTLYDTFTIQLEHIV